METSFRVMALALLVLAIPSCIAGASGRLSKQTREDHFRFGARQRR